MGRLPQLSPESLLKGCRIADGCVVAAGSTVLGNFDALNCLIAGTPAKMIRRDVEWDNSRCERVRS
jgi:acetyltransferase-like isoleucine patch superfamily enzyme